MVVGNWCVELAGGPGEFVECIVGIAVELLALVGVENFGSEPDYFVGSVVYLEATFVGLLVPVEVVDVCD